MKIAVFPGSFDPITTGHVDIVHRALPLFDKIVVAIGVNEDKKTLFSLEQRMTWLKEVFKNDENIIVDHFQGLTVNFCKKIGAHFLVRGLRNASDFDYEKSLKQLSKPVLSISIENDRLASKKAVENLYNKFSSQSDVSHLHLNSQETGISPLNHFNWAKSPEYFVGIIVRWWNEKSVS